MSPFSVYEILAISVMFSLTNTLLTRKMGVRKRMNEIQEKFKDFQERYNAAIKSKDEKKIAAMAEESKQTNDLMMEMMVMPWKTMIFALPLFFIFTGDPWVTHYIGIIPSLFPGFTFTLPFDLHTTAVYSLNVLHNAVYGPRGFFIVGVIFAGIIVSLLETNFDKKRKKAAQAKQPEKAA